MMFTSTIALTILAAASAIAAPVAANKYSNTTLVQTDTLYPSIISTWNVGKGHIQQYNTQTPYVSKFPGNNGEDISVLATFDIPAAHVAANHQCEIVFALTGSGTNTFATGSRIAQIYSSLYPAIPASTSNGRNQQLATIKVEVGQQAVLMSGQMVFPCSAAVDGKYSVEMVPNWDTVFIGWNAGSDGLKVIAHA